MADSGHGAASVEQWEQRVRAPQLVTGSLLGPAVCWASDHADRGVLLANPSGRTEVFAFDATTSPATLTQVSDRPEGTTGGEVSPDGGTCFWFDDRAGDELGRWQFVRLADGSTGTVLAELSPSYPAGLRGLPDGRVVVGRVLDAETPQDAGFEIAVAGPQGSGTVVYDAAEPAALVDVSHDGEVALLSYAPGGDWLHRGVRVVRLADGRVLGELVEPGRNLRAVGFHPADAGTVLVVHEHADREGPGIWQVGSVSCREIPVTMPGDVSPAWYPTGDALLLTVLHDARHRLHRLELSSGESTEIPVPAGTVAESSARIDGSVHVLMSAATMPPTLLRLAHDGTTSLVVLPGEPPSPGVGTADVHAEGPAGRVHALLSVPAGAAPYPTVFLPHGGPTWQDFDAWNERVATLVDAGYAVVRVNYRGSTGYGAAWRDALHGRLGFIELEDITAVRDHLEAAGVVDPARTSVMGGSWGGFLTLMAVGVQPDRWRSGVALVPLADQETSAEDSPSFMKAYDASLFGGTIEELPDLYRAASPITYVDAVVAPLLVSAGENDPRCPVRQVDTYVARLRERGHDVTYDRSATGHQLPDLDLKVTQLRAVLDFLARTLPA